MYIFKNNFIFKLSFFILILMGNGLTVEAAKNFLYNISPKCKTLANFEEFVDKYDGKHKSYLKKVLNFVMKSTKGGNRFFGLGDSEIEDIVKATIPAKSFQTR